MINAIIHKFSVDETLDNINSVSFLRADGTIQTLNNESATISGTFIENGTYTPPEGFVGFDSIEINVPASGKSETIDVELNKSAQTIRPSVGFDGIGEVRVPSSSLKTLSVSLTPNAQTFYAADEGVFGFSSVSVPGFSTYVAPISVQDLTDAGIGLGLTQTVTPQKIFGPDTEIKGFSSFQLPPAILQAKTVTLSTSEQTIEPTDGAYGLSEVTVPSVYEVFTDDWTITQNGDNQIPPSPYLGAGKVNVHVQPVLRDNTFTQNGGPYTAGTGYDGWGTININVPPAPDPHVVEANKNVTITSNGTGIQVTPDVGYNVMSKVTLDVAVPLPSIQTSKTVTLTQNNDSVDIAPDTGFDALSNVHVNVQVPATGNVQASKSVTYTQSGVYTIRADAGYDSLEQANVTVEVNAINLHPQGLFGGGSRYDSEYPDYHANPDILIFTDRLFNTKTSFSASDIGDSYYGMVFLRYAGYAIWGFQQDPVLTKSYPSFEVIEHFSTGTTLATVQDWYDNYTGNMSLQNDATFSDSYMGALGFATDNPGETGVLLEPMTILGYQEDVGTTWYALWVQPWNTTLLGPVQVDFTPYCFMTYNQYS